MKTKNPLWLLMLLLMLPQFAETIYSPALPSVQQQFGVQQQSATLTISLYFIAFASGVAFWGIQSDRIGRKRSLEYGLITYGIGATAALFARDFIFLIVARVVSAFGIAAGSIVTQTILRDTYDTKNISKVFSRVGIGLSISPVIGMITGSLIVSFLNYQGVFVLLFILAIVFLAVSKKSITETAQINRFYPGNVIGLVKRMIGDRKILADCVLIMSFNVMLFSYYSLAPFIFRKNGFTDYEFGYSSIILGMGTFTGAYINRLLLKKGTSSGTLVKAGTFIALTASFFLMITGDHMLFLIPFCFIVMAFGISIPNILSTTLVSYRNEAGSAGAILGLIYYTLIGSGLIWVGVIQHLGLACMIFSGIGIITVAFFHSKQ